ncbi:MAG: hypothetical protein WA418_21430 [Bradyrhizobium sp.]
MSDQPGYGMPLWRPRPVTDATLFQRALVEDFPTHDVRALIDVDAQILRVRLSPARFSFQLDIDTTL